MFLKFLLHHIDMYVNSNAFKNCLDVFVLNYFILKCNKFNFNDVRLKFNFLQKKVKKVIGIIKKVLHLQPLIMKMISRKF
jgi:hypothetical protein